MKTFAQVLKDNPDIDFLFVMDIDDTLIHPVKNRKEFKRHQEWLHRLDILARKYKNFIIVYTTARPMMFNERVNLGFENVAPVDCGNVGWLRSHRKMLEIGYANSAKNLPKKIGIPVPDAIISSLGMTFQVKPSLVNKTPFLKENIEELNKQLLIMAERDTETLRSEIEKFKNDFPDTTVFNNGNIYNQMVAWSNKIIKNKWLFRIPPSNKAVLNTVLEYRGGNAVFKGWKWTGVKILLVSGTKVS